MFKLLKLLTHRVALVVILLLIQLTLLFFMFWRFSEYFSYFYATYLVISLASVLRIINNRSNPGYKIVWLIVVTLLPFVGTFIYLVFGRLRINRKHREKMAKIIEKKAHALECTRTQATTMKKTSTNVNAIIQSQYLTNYGLVPPFANTKSTYLPIGEAIFESMKEELEKAESFIFMEYFIIQEGKMWNEILEILVRKAKDGVDVRLIYDDMGCIFTLPHHYDRKLEEMGIKCCVFNPFVPILSSVFNNRNHRKITVIDGKVAFTGGNNLADEYINAIEKHGHWKDTGIVMEGEAVWGFTLMFLGLWDFIRGEPEDYCVYYHKFEEQPNVVGYYQPYTDLPFDEETIGENVYLNLINRATSYIFITTPYLIVDNLLMEALCTAAKSGIDVRIQTPFIPDKWYVHAVTRSNYEQLIEAGVRIFEYTPGFIHSKTFLVDGLFATVGTINLDYRSLYLHLECGVWMYQTEAIPEMEADFIETQDICTEITLEKSRDVPWLIHLGRAVLNVFAPLM